MEKILISACFLGEKVRYDGKANTLTHSIIEQWRVEKRLISVCPEVYGGLVTPRVAAEIQPVAIKVNPPNPPNILQDKHALVKQNKILTQQGENVSEAFYRGANIALELCLENNIRFALLKESSPSCGSTYIYDGSFTNIKVKGEGVTAELLRRNDIAVYSECNIEKLIQKLLST